MGKIIVKRGFQFKYKPNSEHFQENSSQIYTVTGDDRDACIMLSDTKGNKYVLDYDFISDNMTRFYDNEISSVEFKRLQVESSQTPVSEFFKFSQELNNSPLKYYNSKGERMDTWELFLEYTIGQLITGNHNLIVR